MTQRYSTHLGVLAALGLLTAAGCTRDTSHFEPVPPNTDAVVFADGFGDGVDFQAFLGSDYTALSLDTVEKFQGTASLKVTVPNPGNPNAGYAGGAFPTNSARDLSGYNALTFWAKASRTATLDIAGLGNDNTGASLYQASWAAIPLTTTWTRVVVPIPLPEKLDSERGLFFFAEGPEQGAGYDLWFDEIRFDRVTNISDPRPSILTQTVGTFVGALVGVTGARTVFSVGGTDEAIDHSPNYLTFSSSDESVATVENGTIAVVGGGSATIIGKLGEIEATGEVTLNVTASPTEPAPAPTLPPADVVSVFSNVYSNVAIDTWSAVWDRADVTDFTIAGDDVKVYTNLLFAGIEFTSAPVDASEMTHFHADLWVPRGTIFRVKLVDFGPDGEFGGGDDREHELPFNANSTPPLVADTWVGLEVPFSAFTGLTTRGHLAQLIISGDTGTAYLDNIYFHK